MEVYLIQFQRRANWHERSENHAVDFGRLSTVATGREVARKGGQARNASDQSWPLDMDQRFDQPPG